jgi:WD40 repeat protein
MSQSVCPAAEILTAFNLGDLPEAELERVAAHLDACSACEERASQADATTDPVLCGLRRLAGEQAATLPVVPADSAGAPLLCIGEYEVLSELGRGGMGVVYKARHRRLGRLTAVKVLPGGEFADPQRRARLLREAEAVARLQHPGIVQLFEAGEYDAGDGQRPYLALEYVDGGPLSARTAGTPQPPRLAAAWVEALARAVQHAHEKGVIHRDLKPSNVLLTADRQPKVCDFGVARLSASGSATQVGTLVGTPEYMAPEQAGSDEIGPATDVYALGVVLYALIAGRPPFQATSPLDTVMQVLTLLPPAPRQLQPGSPRDLETICLKCLEKDPRRRYATAGALADDLRRFLDGRPTLARPLGSVGRALRWARRNPAVATLAACVVAVALVGLSLVLWHWDQAIRERTRAEHNAQDADTERHAALFQAYRARIAAAVAALQNHDVVAAAYQLDRAPPPLHYWEWLDLQSRLDESVQILPPADGESLGLVAAPRGPRLVGMDQTRLVVRDLDGQEGPAVPLNRFPRLFATWMARDGLVAVAQDAQHTARVFDEAGRLQLTARASELGELRAVALSPDRKRLAAFWWREQRPCSFYLFGAASADAVARCHGHTDFIYNLTFSPDSTRVLSASEDGTARVWDAQSGASVAVLRGRAVKVLHAAFAPDGTRVVTASGDGTVRQWDARTGQEVETPFEGHTGDVLVATYSPDGQWIASGGTDHTVRLWRARRRTGAVVLHGHKAHVNRLAFRADGHGLASQDSAGIVRVWDTDACQRLPVLHGHGSYVYSVAYSPDGRWIASGSWDKTARLWNAATGELRATLPHANVLRTLAFDPDGTCLVTACDDAAALDVWEVPTDRRVRQLPWPGPRIAAVAVHPGGARLAAFDVTGKVIVLDLTTGIQLAATQTGRPSVRGALAFSPNGRWLAGVGADSRTINLWDSQTLEARTVLAGHTADVYSLAFSKDGHWLVSAGADRTVRVCDLARATCIRVLRGHTDDVFSAVFHPDLKRIASAGRDRMIWLLDVQTGEEVARLPGHTNYVFSLAFSPDGATLVSGSGDSTVRLWDTVPLAQRARSR